MVLVQYRIRLATIVLVALSLCSQTNAADEAASKVQVRRAMAFLDARQEVWAKFSGSGRGEGEGKTTCLSCHTGISYAMARPSIGRFLAGPAASAAEDRMVAQVGLRVEHWGELDSPRFNLMYDFDERKKIESRGTEAVLDALILARDDASKGKTEPSATTRKALAHLWEAQLTEGPDAGSWEWLNFGLEPWEGAGSRAFGASMAAIAVGKSPGYLARPLDEDEAKGVARLRDYLKRRFPDESSHNRLWIVEASGGFPGIVSADQKRGLVDQILAKQRDDGGWSLAGLGNFRRVDGSVQLEESDGYATGLALHTLIRLGSDVDRPKLAKGIGWIKSHQREDGSWPGVSVNKERDPATFAGKLMTDAATSFAALALVEAGAP